MKWLSQTTISPCLLTGPLRETSFKVSTCQHLSPSGSSSFSSQTGTGKFTDCRADQIGKRRYFSCFVTTSSAKSNSSLSSPWTSRPRSIISRMPCIPWRPDLLGVLHTPLNIGRIFRTIYCEEQRQGYFKTKLSPVTAVQGIISGTVLHSLQ